MDICIGMTRVKPCNLSSHDSTFLSFLYTFSQFDPKTKKGEGYIKKKLENQTREQENHISCQGNSIDCKVTFNLMLSSSSSSSGGLG